MYDATRDTQRRGPLTQTYFAGGALSYTFPTVSYLG